MVRNNTHLLKVGRMQLGTSDAVRDVLDFILQQDYKIIVVSAPGPTEADPNMTDLLDAIVCRKTKPDPNDSTRGVLWNGVSVRTPLARFRALAQGLLTDRHNVARFLNDIETDLDAALKCSSPQYPDPYVSRGEYWMAKLVSEALKERGPIYPVMQPETFLRCDGNGSVDLEASKKMLGGREYRLKVRPLQPMIIPGYYAGNEKDDIVLLARDGTHITATVVAILLNLDQIHSLSNLSGIPIVPASIMPSRVMEVVSYLELVALARVDPHEFQPQALELMQKHHISMWVYNLADRTTGGTLLTYDPAVRAVADMVSGIGVYEASTMISVSYDKFDHYGVIKEVGTIFANQKINVHHYKGSGTSLTYVFNADKRTSELTCGLFKKKWPQANVTMGTCAVVYIVGIGMEKTPGILTRFAKALSDQHINVIKALPGDEHELAVAIKPEDTENAVRALYEEFFEKSQVVA